MHVTSHDLFLIAVLVFLEGILSVDNALVLALLARHLPKRDQKKALSYGLLGAFLFRFVALAMVTYLTRWEWVKYVGGGYLIYLAVKNLRRPRAAYTSSRDKSGTSFWKTVIAIELADIAFAIDSILAGVALTPKIWIVFTGGILGIILMRFTASAFIRLIERFPRLERSAYSLVLVIGLKLILEAMKLPGVDFQSPHALSFAIFWGLMAICFGIGFIPPRTVKKSR